MTEEEKLKRKAENEAVCMAFAVKDGLVDAQPSIENLHFISRMAHYVFVEDHEPNFYSWDDDWSYGPLPAQKMAESVIARMRVTGFLLRDFGIIPDTSIHVWNDGDNFVFVLASPVDSELEDPWNADEDFKALMVVSYSSSSGDHADLVSDYILRYVNFAKVIEDGRELVGFESYGRHDLNGYLNYVGMYPFFNKNGMFKPRRVFDQRESGSDVFGMDGEGFSIVQMLKW